MKDSRRFGLGLLLAVLNAPAFACSFFPLEPQEKFQMNSTAVLAYPIAIATAPENATAPEFRGDFSQTIQWQVLISWKGRYRPGEVITTMTKHSTSVCGTGAQYEREVMLLFLDGNEPFESIMRDRPVHSIEEFKYLDRVKRGG